MDQYESTVHPFIVKVWLEETAEATKQVTWRGHITHVPSGRRCYIQNLGEIIAFIAPYLRALGVTMDDTM
jgi:hypothetical protein